MKVDFRSIPLGDLNLLSEVGKADIIEYRDVRRQKTGALIRRVPVVVGRQRIHQARIFGSQEMMTAVIYDGPGFEKVTPIFSPDWCMLIYLWYSGGPKWKCVRRAGGYSWQLKRLDV
jgi:hypothetical protein